MRLKWMIMDRRADRLALYFSDVKDKYGDFRKVGPDKTAQRAGLVDKVLTAVSRCYGLVEREQMEIRFPIIYTVLEQIQSRVTSGSPRGGTPVGKA